MQELEIASHFITLVYKLVNELFLCLHSHTETTRHFFAFVTKRSTIKSRNIKSFSSEQRKLMYAVFISFVAQKSTNNSLEDFLNSSSLQGGHKKTIFFKCSLNVGNLFVKYLSTSSSQFIHFAMFYIIQNRGLYVRVVDKHHPDPRSDGLQNARHLLVVSSVFEFDKLA